MFNCKKYKEIFDLIDKIENNNYIPKKSEWHYDLQYQSMTHPKNSPFKEIFNLQDMLSERVVNYKGKIKLVFTILMLIKRKSIVIGPHHYGIDSGHYTILTSKGPIDFKIKKRGSQ